MRSVRELLRDYNFVNTPEGRRGTIRFFAGLVTVAAAAFMVLFIATSGPEDGGSTYQSGSEQDPFEVYATPHGKDSWYIGYPTELYDAEQRDHYDEGEVLAKLEHWREEYSIAREEPVRSDDEHEVLLGYVVKLSALSIDRPILLSP